jgi:hypothetical protein
MIIIIFKMVFTWNYIKIIFFKIIFNINILISKLDKTQLKCPENITSVFEVQKTTFKM